MYKSKQRYVSPPAPSIFHERPHGHHRIHIQSVVSALCECGQGCQRYYKRYLSNCWVGTGEEFNEWENKVHTKENHLKEICREC